MELRASRRPGDTLGHYRLLERLGSGGGGVVWKALDTTLEREVALKLVPDALSGDAAALARLEREARAAATLSHPNVATLFSVEEHEGTRFLTMELVRGRTLEAIVPAGGLPLDRLLDLALPLVDAVAAAHERGITHGDLKPRNVMVGEDGRLKVLDFGLAVFRPLAAGPAGSEAETRTRPGPGALAGTLPYMSPEQLQGRDSGPASDIFSLGVTLYEMATGRRPFVGATSADLVASILRDAPAVAGALEGALGALAPVIERCLEKDARRRWSSAAELRDELARLGDSGAPSGGTIAPSVAVLPFTDMSPDKDQGYFCEGMAEEIIAALTRVEGLRVASRTSSFALKGVADTRQIGRRLRVATVLEGSVRKSGRRIRITAELTDVASGYHLWSERFDRELPDVFAIQEEIALALQRRLVQATVRPPRPAPTADLDAYDYFLRGRQFYFQYTRRGMQFALEMFSHAIERDPAYARAHAGIAMCCAFLYIYAQRSESNREKAEEASRRALELDPGLAEAHVSRGVALSAAGRDAEAEEAFETARSLDPRLFEASYLYARHSFARGQLEKAARLYEEAAAARPEDYQAPLLVAEAYCSLGEPGRAEATRRRGLALAEDRLRVQPDDVRARYMGANALVALGEREKGLAWARAARALDPEEPMLLYNVGCIQALAGEAEAALDCLEHAVAAGLTERGWFLHDSDLDSLRPLPRFRSLLERLGPS